jgi:hypothetical protein
MVLVRGGITVKPHVQRAADDVVAEFGPGLSPGTYNGHSPPEGPTQALDLFTPNNWAGYELQERICAWLIKNAKKYGIRYCIRHNPNGADWIWNIERAGEGWRAMATNDHRDHVHVTFYSRVEVEPDIPEIPDPVKGLDMASLAVRFVFPTQEPGQVGNLDYVFDGPSHIFGPVGSLGVLKACDVVGMPAIGLVNQGDFDWFSAQANTWRS